MRRALATIAVAVVLALGGCAADNSYSDATAQSLQTTVLAVTQASSDGDWGAAQTALDAVATQVAAALAAGEITEERAAEIQAAIATVRDDLNELIATQQQPADQDSDNGDENGNGPGGNGPPGKKDEKDKPGKKD